MVSSKTLVARSLLLLELSQTDSDSYPRMAMHCTMYSTVQVSPFGQSVSLSSVMLNPERLNARSHHQLQMVSGKTLAVRSSLPVKALPTEYESYP